MQKNNQLHHSFCKTKNSLQQSNGFLAIQSVLPWAFQEFWMIFFKLLVRWLAWILSVFCGGTCKKTYHCFGAYAALKKYHFEAKNGGLEGFFCLFQLGDFWVPYVTFSGVKSFRNFHFKPLGYDSLYSRGSI